MSSSMVGATVILGLAILAFLAFVVDVVTARGLPPGLGEIGLKVIVLIVTAAVFFAAGAIVGIFSYGLTV